MVDKRRRKGQEAQLLLQGRMEGFAEGGMKEEEEEEEGDEVGVERETV